MVSLGNGVLGGLCARDGSVVGRVSVADASLSLSLSLWAGWRSAGSALFAALAGLGAPPCGGFWRTLGLSRRSGLARRVVLVGLVWVCVLVGVLVVGGGVALAAGLPTVGGESALSVGSVSASVGAQIGAEGSPTSYEVEYGESEAYGSVSLEASVGAPAEPVSVSVQLSGLAPGSVYHARFVASNETGRTVGADFTFTTAASLEPTVSGLPDNRVYELVSSPTGNQDVYTPTSGAYTEEDFNTERPYRAST
jgi:hypothetical protein